MERLGVVPACERDARRRLFDALAAAFEVEVVAGAEGVDAAIVLSGSAPAGIRSVVYGPGGERREEAVRLHDAAGLDPRLRGRTLRDARAAGPGVGPAAGDVVLASAGGVPVWARRGGVDLVAVAPDELAPTESLRDRLVDGCFLGLLPIVELLRAMAGGRRWAPPPPRACFVLDDPNLHRPTYGHVDFRALAAHAREHGYHVAVATVPADQWLVDRRAAAAFREAGTLSLAVHGNGHLPGELGRSFGPRQREALVAQALRRVESLERRAALHVARVMVAPHEACSDEMAETLLRSEIEALCYGYGARSAERPLADWAPVDLRGSGLPVLPRRPLHALRGELVLRAYLDQPLILGLHHWDLADGLDVLAHAAEELDRLARPQWAPLDEIARTRVERRRDGGTLTIRPYSRRFAVDIPPDVERLAIELPPTHAAPDAELLCMLPGERLTFAFRRRDAFDHRAVPAPRPQPWAFQRRLLTEARDRLAKALP